MNIAERIADLERQLADLKAEAARPVVEYREAEWLRDWGREDAEFRNTQASDWIPGTLAGWRSGTEYAWIASTCYAYCECRVPKVPSIPTYRTPSLPADAGKVCEFSDDQKEWRSGRLIGWDEDYWRCNQVGSFHYCRIKD